ncbi:hypothetical protein [Limnohabitans sp.]
MSELEGVGSANLFGNSMTDMGLGAVRPLQISATHRLPKSSHGSEPMERKKLSPAIGQLSTHCGLLFDIRGRSKAAARG